MYFRAITSNDVDGTVSSAVDKELNASVETEIKLHDPVVDQPVFIRLADTDQQRSAARILLNRRYSWRGYGGHHVIANSPSHTTFTASSGTGLLGTITLAIDSPGGLSADKLFKDVIDSFRVQPGASVCELTKFAFDTSKPSKPMLAALFHLIFIYGHREYGCTDLFIEVNPRHVRFYETLLGFQRLGALQTNDSVAAPAQLMWLSVASIREQIDVHAGVREPSTSRSLYGYFFSPSEEDGLYGRMLASRSAYATRSGARMPAQSIRKLFSKIGMKANLPLPRYRSA